jgi:hypothetical protein
MEPNKLNLPVRIVIAVIMAVVILKLVFSGVPSGEALTVGGKVFALILAIVYGIMLFFLFGWSFMESVGDQFGRLFMPSDSNYQIVPEYSVAEARVAAGKYQEAIDEYRKVIVDYPNDIYPHLRIAELAVKHLNDLKLAEIELLSGTVKAQGEVSMAIAAGRLADFYQFNRQDVARALEVMKQLREKIPGTKQAKLAEERITVLEGFLTGNASPPQTPGKIAPRPSRFKMTE